MLQWFRSNGLWLIVILALGYSINRYFSHLPELTNGTVAPTFELIGLDGKEYRLSALKGRYIFIDFWGSWCDPCRRSHPKWATLYRELREEPSSEPFIFVSIARESNRNEWKRAIEEDGLVWYAQTMERGDESTSIINSYGVNAFPTNYLINKEGLIIGVNVSPEFVRDRIAQSR